MPEPIPVKALVHINFDDRQRQAHGLTNIEHILDELADTTRIEVITHGPGISLVVQDEASHPEQISRLMSRGVRFTACENTLEGRTIPQDRLLPGVGVVRSGAAEVLRRQQEGYAYFRP